jgi:hypothetical protein
VLGLHRREEFDLTEGSVGRTLVGLAVPVVATALLQTAYNLIDTVCIGRYGSPELAALTFSSPLVFTCSRSAAASPRPGRCWSRSTRGPTGRSGTERRARPGPGDDGGRSRRESSFATR